MKQSDRGFGLIEVLIALVIISVGLLALASLNTNTFGLSLESQWRLSASYIAESMATRMEMNFIEARKTNSAYTGSGMNNNCLRTVSCTPTQMAQYDVYELKQQAKKMLPSGDVTVTGNIPIFTITVSWTGKDNVNRNYITSVRP